MGDNEDIVYEDIVGVINVYNMLGLPVITTANSRLLFGQL